MRRRRSVAVLAALCCFAAGLLGPVGAQEELAVSLADPELEAALFARRDSLEMQQRAEALRKAQAAELEAVASLPEVRAIDAELEGLRARVRELLMLRHEVIERHAATLQTYRTEVEQAREDLRAADPVRQVLDQRRAELVAELETAAP